MPPLRDNPFVDMIVIVFCCCCFVLLECLTCYLSLIVRNERLKDIPSWLFFVGKLKRDCSLICSVTNNLVALSDWSPWYWPVRVPWLVEKCLPSIAMRMEGPMIRVCCKARFHQWGYAQKSVAWLWWLFFIRPVRSFLDPLTPVQKAHVCFSSCSLPLLRLLNSKQ